MFIYFLLCLLSFLLSAYAEDSPLQPAKANLSNSEKLKLSKKVWENVEDKDD